MRVFETAFEIMALAATIDLLRSIAMILALCLGLAVLILVIIERET